MRGYRQLREAKRLELFVDVGEAMTNEAAAYCAKNTSPLFFGAGKAQAESIIRQYALVRVTRLTLNRALLESLGNNGAPVVHPLPSEWRAVLKRHGFRVAGVRSAIAWWGYVFLLWGYGVLSIARKVVGNLSFTPEDTESARELGRYAYFDRLTADHLPQPSRDGRSFDVVTWYAQWLGRPVELDSLCHNVTGVRPAIVDNIAVRAIRSPLPPLRRRTAQLRFLAWGIAASTLAAVDMLRGRWWHAMLLGEASSGAVARMLPADRLARDYLFHVVGYLYRPLWTYEAEQKGSRIIFYNYSTNLETFKYADGYHTQAHSWHAITWPIYLVWDDGQAEFFRRAVGDDADIRVVGPIWFSTSDLDMPPVAAPAVAVFDVQPHRASRHQVAGLPYEYYVPQCANRFLLDVHSAIRDAGGWMVFKRKRDIGRLMHRSYAAVADHIGAAEDVITVDPSVAAVRVIEQCQAVISMPFTSTALLGRAMGKPSIYYDPHGMIQQDDRAAHGIPVVVGHDELRRWIAANIHLAKPHAMH